MTLASVIALVAVVVLVTVAAIKRRKRPRPPILVSAEAQQWASEFYQDDFSRDVAARFIMIVAEYTPVKINKLSPATTFVADLGLDDLEPVEIVMAMEDEFRIQIADKDAQNLLSISDVISYIILRIGNENGA